MTVLWMLYLALRDTWAALHQQYHQVTAQPEAGDMNISKALYAALAVALGAIVVAAVTAAVNTNLGQIGAPAAPAPQP